MKFSVALAALLCSFAAHAGGDQIYRGGLSLTVIFQHTPHGQPPAYEVGAVVWVKVHGREVGCKGVTGEFGRFDCAFPAPVGQGEMIGVTAIQYEEKGGYAIHYGSLLHSFSGGNNTDHRFVITQPM